MSTAHKRITVDRLSGVLVALMVLFQLSALSLVARWMQYEMPEQQSNPTLGIEVFVLAMVEIGVLLLIWRGYLRLSEFYREHIKAVLIGLGLGGVIWLSWQWGAIWAVPLAGGVTKLIQWLDFSHRKWLLFNLIAFTIGIFLVAMIGMGIAPIVVLTVMLLFTAYDILAVDLSSIMGDLISLSASTGIPNYIMIPTGWNLDYSAVKAFLKGESDRPENLAFLIGLGDFVFPALLTVSVAVQLDSIAALPVLGSLLGTSVAAVVLRHSAEHREGGLPALPWLNSGAIGGFLIGVLFYSTPFIGVLGL